VLNKKAIDIIGTLLLFLGLLLAFLPHAAHVSAGLKEDHLQHIITGFALVIISLAVLIHNNKALKWMK